MAGAGDITISGGGLTSVGTDEMLDHARALRALAPQIDEWAATLLSPAARPDGTRPAPEWRSDDPEVHLLAAYTALNAAGERAGRLASELTEAAERYGRAERSAQALSRTGGAVVGWILGLVSPLLLLEAVGLALTTTAAFLLATTVTGSPQATSAAAGRWLRRSGLLSNPVLVSWVRAAVSSADDAMLGAARVPLPIALALDDDATGWFGLRGATGVVVALAGPRLLKETPVVVNRAGPHSAPEPVPPARRFADLAARIPPAGVGKPQLRIERYIAPDGGARWIVYAGGTIDPGFAATGEPWDDTSNVQGVGQLDPGSVRAALQALADAGAEPGDEVLSVGYSQGGIVATDLVRQGGYTNAGLVTFGSPTGQMTLPADVPDVAVEIDNDMVPALGGEPLDARHDGLHRVVVSRTIYDDAHPAPSDRVLPAHALANYRETAGLMDASGDPRLEGMRERIAAFTGGRSPQVSLWRADRVPAGATASSAGAG